MHLVKKNPLLLPYLFLHLIQSLNKKKYFQKCSGEKKILIKEITNSPLFLAF